MTAHNSANERLELASWRFKPSHLGCLADDAGVIEFKPLTLVCGQNNTGKTWVLYALYAFLGQHLQRLELPEINALLKELNQEGTAIWDMEQWARDHGEALLKNINNAVARRLPQVFNGDSDLFQKSRFDWEVNLQDLTAQAIKRPFEAKLALGRDENEVLLLKKAADAGQVQIAQKSEFFDAKGFISGIVAGHFIGHGLRRNVFLMPAERNGLHLFYRELASRRTALLHHASKKDRDIDIGQLIQDVVKSRYAKPIADYIDWLNELPETRKKKKGPFHHLAEEIKPIVGGRYDVGQDGEISFTPRKAKRGGKASPKLDLHLTSSTVKSLFGLWAYLEFDAQIGDVLMIDEPELNLHPSNQRRVARLLARLVNAGLRVVVSTHSDYLVREINSLIMLSRPASVQHALMEKYSYQPQELLTTDKVAAWLFCDSRIQPMQMDDIEGIAAQTFDEQVNEINDSSDDIYYTYQQAEQAEGSQ